MSTPTFTYIVPAYNEAEILEDTVTRIVEHLAAYPGSEVLVVENGSTDDTFERATALAARSWGDVAVRAMRSDKGLATAYRAGAEAATGGYLVFTAADLPFEFSDLDSFLALDPEQRPAFAIGSKAHPASEIERTLARKVMSRGFRVLRWAVIGASPQDPQGSLILESGLGRRLATATEGAGYIFGTELAALAAAEDVKAVELPVRLADERRSSTVRPVQDSLKMFRSLLEVRRRLDRAADDGASSWLRERSGPGALVAAVAGERSPWRGALAALLAAALGIALLACSVLAFAAGVRNVVESSEASPSNLSLLVVGGGIVLAIGIGLGLVAFAVRQLLPARDPDPGPAPVADAPPPRWARWGLSAVASVAAAVAMLWRVLGDLTGTALGGGDGRYWYWIGWRLADQIRGGDLLPFSVMSVVWPMGYSLRVADGALPAAVTTAWNLVVGDPTLAYNLANATAAVTTCLAGVRLARAFAVSPAIAAACGFALATAPALLVRAEGHYNLLFAFPAVLLVDVGVRHVLRRRQPLPVVRTAVLLVLAYLSSGYYLALGLLALAAVLAAGAASWRRLAVTGVRLFVAAVAAVVVLSPFLVPKLRLEARETELGAVGMSASAEAFASDATSVFLPPDGTLLPPPGLEHANDSFEANVLEGTAYPGALLLAAVGALVFFRGPIRRALLAGVTVVWVVSLGPTLIASGDHLPEGAQWLPASLILDLPGFDGVRAPNRGSFLVAILATAAAALALGWVARRGGKVLGAATAVVAVALAVASIRVPATSTPDVDGDLEAALVAARELPDDGALLQLPDDCLFTVSDVEYQILHQRPLVGCNGFTSAIPWRDRLGPYAASAAWAALRCEPYRVGTLPSPFPTDEPPTEAAVRALRSELGVGIVLFDTDNRCPERADAILDVLTTAGTEIARGGGMVVIQLPAQEGAP